MVKKILVLDDEENYAEMLESLLEQHYFVVDSATKPELALKSLEQEGYDLVISDYKMPVMDGADFLQKARDINPDLPFIIISGLMNTPELVKVANMGVTLVLEKPIDIENFLNQVKRFVAPLPEEEYAKVVSGKEGSKAIFAPDGRRFIKTYPDQPSYLADRSPAMQFFLQDFWDAIQEQSHVFVSTGRGIELDLMIMEIAAWKGLPGQTPLVLRPGKSAGQLLEHFKKTEGGDSAARYATVTGFAHSTLEDQAALVDAICEAPEDFSFIYFVAEELLRNPEQHIDAELLELIRESLCRMPPLRHRPSDLVAYVERYLPQLAKAESRRDITGLDPAAGALLLSHAWPGNFAELMAVLRRAISIETSSIITAESLAAAFREPLEVRSLEAQMSTIQKDLLQDMAVESGETLEQVAESVGLDAGRLNGEQVPLLFPELLQT